MAAADRLAQLPAQLARLAPGPQRVHAPGPRLHRPRGEQEGRGHPRLPAAGRELPALGRRPLPALHATTSTSSSPASSRRWTTCRWTRRSSTARAGIGIWDWASNDEGGDPDVVMACAGDIPTLETLAAVALLREHLPDLKVRVVNVVDLMRLQPDTEHPHGLLGPRVRRALHGRPAGHLRLPRLPVAHPPADLPADEPRQPPRARLQGGGDDHDAVRHGHAERHGPVPPGHGRHRPRAGARRAARRTCARRWSTGDCAPAPTRARREMTWRTSATGDGLANRRAGARRRAVPGRRRSLRRCPTCASHRA